MTKTALISVYYKDGILDFAKELALQGFEIYSTGGTYKFLKENSVDVKSIESLTSFPEILDGRVKTLHPNVFAGILAEKDNENHRKNIAEHKLKYFDLVVVNLYPFTETVANASSTQEEIIEKIDIGGVSLIRAAAKNFKYVNVLVDPSQYMNYIEELKKEGSISQSYSSMLAYRAFSAITEYDAAIQEYYQKINFQDETPDWINISRRKELRYGENPHQKAYIVKDNFDDLFEVIHGIELSYNNMLDIDAAYSIIKEFEYDNPATAIIKHGNPSGIAVSNNLFDSYVKAYETDTVSPFGGIIIFNRKLDYNTASEVHKLFTEILIAPDFDEDALALLMKKKNRRLVKFKFGSSNFEFKKITGGILVQEKDKIVFDKDNIKTVTKIKPADSQMKDLEFAFKVVKHTKSNAVVFVKNMQTLGIGAGQPSRIDSTKLAVMKAKQFGLDLKGSIVASDAFFPFADGLIELANAGAACVIQPGGSVRDDEVIKAADEFGIAMVFTGVRHFRH